LKLCFPRSHKQLFSIKKHTTKNAWKKIKIFSFKIKSYLKQPRISHTAEAFWALNILLFRKLGIFNVIKFLFQLKGDQLPPTFKKKISHYQKISKTQILETETIFIFLE